jgi:predicted RNase H-like HicB family nuclease
MSARALARKYRVVFQREISSGSWRALIDRSQGVSCVAQGRTVAAARKGIREALALYLGNAELAHKLELVESFALAGSARHVVSELIEARARLHEASRRYAAASGAASRQLAKAGISRRDAAAILELSPGRVQQLLNQTD